jgi:malonate decarboxylase epsilon subunit
MLALQFPGQGAQSIGFLHRLPPHPVVDATLDEASQILGTDILALDTADALRSTVAVQIGLVVAGVVVVRVLADAQLTPEVNAGLSVGAYAAAVSCGALHFADALRMVRKRAELMETAYPDGYGLAAISGLTEPQLETLAAQQLQQGNERVYIGNVNAPRQIVMAGSDAALEALIARALSAGARKATRLAVSVPSHCELLADAANELIDYARDVPFQAPHSVYVGNRGGRPLQTAEAIRADLATNMRYTVRWFDAVSVMLEMGAQVLVEAPPGQVLTDIVREQSPATTAIALSSLAPERWVGTVRHRVEAAGR